MEIKPLLNQGAKNTVSAANDANVSTDAFSSTDKIHTDLLLKRSLEDEKRIYPFRLAVLISSGIIYFSLMDRPYADQRQALILFVLASIYALVIHFIQPYKKYPVQRSQYVIAIGDGLLITLWVYLTGKINSPFYLIYFASIAAVAVRQGIKGTLWAASFYSAAYLAVVAKEIQTLTDQIDIFVRVFYIYLTGGIAVISTERVKKQALEVFRFHSFQRERSLLKEREEQERHESAVKLRFTLESARVGTWSWDRTTNTLECSENLPDIFHQPRGFFSKNIASLHSRVLPEDQAKIASAIVSSKDNEGRYSVEFRVLDANDHVHWIEEKAMVLLGSNGLPSRMSGINIDISARKIVEEENRIRSLQQAAVSEISRKGLDNEKLDIIFDKTTKLIQEVLGVGRVDIWESVSDGPNMLLKSTTSPVSEKPAKDCSAGSASAKFSITLPIPGSKGAYGSLVVNSFEPRRFSHDDVHFLKLLANVLAAVIDRQNLQSELMRRVEEMADADKRKDEFLAMLAHELRNPLAPIYNALVVLEQGNEDTARAAREMISRQIQHLARLVDDLLDISRVTRGKITLKKEHFDLSNTLRRSVETCEHIFREKNHKVQLNMDDQDVYLDADRTRVEQVFINVLNNAAKYTDPGGKISVSSKFSENQAIIEIADNGVGMSPEMLKHAFDIFVQADRSLNRARGGLGIGLTLVKNIVELHGGSIQAFSAGLGKGTLMKIILPATRVAKAKTKVKDPAVSAPRQKEPLKLLVVDDSPDAAEFLSVLLSVWGFHVNVAHDGKTALDVTLKESPDVVLLDIGLPGMDGYEVARQIRAKQSAKSIKLIALTGYGRVEDRQNALDAGFDYHMVKPVHPEVLKQLLTAISFGEPISDLSNSKKSGSRRLIDELSLH
jgi:signal transduction histidine kinase/CheY-like chemotaxis protein/PAS domain-containing protein